MKKALILLLFLVLPALAQSPEATVGAFYRDWHHYSSQEYKSQSRKDWLEQHRRSMSVELYDPLHKALSIKPERGLPPIDFDPFTNCQVSFMSYHVGRAQIEGEKAVVPVAVRVGMPWRGDSGNLQYFKVPMIKTGQGWRISDIVYNPESSLASILEKLKDWKPVQPRLTNQEAVKLFYDEWLSANHDGQPTPEATAEFVENHRHLLEPELAELLMKALKHSPPLTRNPFCNGPYKMVSYQITHNFGDSFAIQIRREDANGQSHVQGVMVDADDARVKNIIYGPPDGNLELVCKKHLGLPE